MKVPSNSKELRKLIVRKGLFVSYPIPPELRRIEGEVKLGRGIIDRAIMDAADGDTVALTWFDQSNPDFIEVCFIAQLDHHSTIQRALTVIRKLTITESPFNV